MSSRPRPAVGSSEAGLRPLRPLLDLALASSGRRRGEEDGEGRVPISLPCEPAPPLLLQSFKDEIELTPCCSEGVSAWYSVLESWPAA